MTQKVVKRLVQVTSAMKQDGENRVGLNQSETAFKVSQKMAEAAAARPNIVGKALNELKVQELFYKVKQKPGKPLFFGKKDDTHIFALPGNPAAALSCFYIYVYITLQKMMDNDVCELPKKQATTLFNFTKYGDRPQFLKAIYKDGNVSILDGQSSAMQQTFALSNTLVYLPESISKIEIGDSVEAILLPI